MKNLFRIKLYHVEGYRVYNQMNYKPGRIGYSFLMEGEALVEVEGKNYLMNPGQMLLVPGDKEIIVKHVSNAVGYDGSFTIDFLKDASYPVLHNQEALLQSFWFDDAVFMAALFKRMDAAFEDKDWAFLQSAMDLILGQLRGPSRVAVIPEKFLQMVFERDKAPMNVADYATLLGVTPNYLNKTVKNHTHRTAIDWIEIARLNMAKQYLKDRSLSIAQIAEKTGLVDQSYFSRFFKKKTGVTPTEFRNSL